MADADREAAGLVGDADREEAGPDADADREAAGPLEDADGEAPGVGALARVRAAERGTRAVPTWKGFPAQDAAVAGSQAPDEGEASADGEEADGDEPDSAEAADGEARALAERGAGAERPVR